MKDLRNERAAAEARALAARNEQMRTDIADGIFTIDDVLTAGECRLRTDKARSVNHPA